jgi:membrane-bound lytic murein transglycosylase F
LDSLLNEYIGSEKFNIIYNKYFKSSTSFKKRYSSEYYTLTSGIISPYDALIKKYSKKINWDWRLFSSIVYQESQFDPKAGSWAGAKGLMQLMPKTAEKLGVKNPYNAKQCIEGGSKYLKILFNRWNNIPDTTQRLKFTLASYNCGYGHVLDAQRLAKIKGVNPLIWDNNVDEFILLLSLPEHYNKEEVRHGYTRGNEPFNYVRDIFSRYYEYKDMLDN